LLLRGVSLGYSLNVAKKIRKSVKECLIKDENNTYKVTLSLGISLFKSGDDENTLIKRAQEGILKAKKRGGNCFST